MNENDPRFIDPRSGEAASVDLTAVHRDDEFLDAIADGRSVPLDDPATAELAGLMFAWRTEVLADPPPARPTLTDVETAIAAEQAALRRRSTTRNLRLVSGAAGILALAGAGLMVMSENSQPGDPLWSVKKVVFASEAEQTQARVDVQSTLESAQEAVDAGDDVRADQLITKAQGQLEAINDRDTRERMQQWIRRLQDDNGDHPATTDTSAPDAATLPSDVTGQDPSSSVTVTIPSDSSSSSVPSSPSPSSSVPSSSTTPSATSSSEAPAPSTTVTADRSVPVS